MVLKRSDQIPNDTNRAVKELVQAFIRNWCLKVIEKSRDKEAKTKAEDIVEVFSWRWYKEIVEPANSNPRNKLASGSEWVFPSRGDLNRPIARSTLNVVVRALKIDVRDFVIHDFRRTASTHLHEVGFNFDWIEKCLAHETKGIRRVYNRAQYADQRKEMLQRWADFVDSQIQDERGEVIIGLFGKAYQAGV
jgi:integrase